MRTDKLFVTVCIFILTFFIYIYADEPDNTAISKDGVNISFSKQGEGEPTIILVHGWSNNKSIWNEQVSYFSKKYETVAIDLAGFGESGNNRSDWTIENFANDVVAVANKLDLKKIVLVGFSMGGPVVVETANMLTDRVIGIVLVDNMQNVEMKVPEQMIGKIDSVMMDLVTNPTQEKLVKGGFVTRDPESAFKLALTMLDNPKVGWEESLRNSIRWQNNNRTEELLKLQVPVLAINSERMPTNTEAFKKYVPSFKADIVPGVGHVIMWDAPEKFNSLLEKDIQYFVSGEKTK